MTEKILVTGGLGMVGAFVCRGLLAAGYRPVIYDQSASKTLIEDVAAGCDIVQGNVTDLPRLAGCVKEHRIQAILHFAAAVGPTVESAPWSSIQSNLVGATTVFEVARLTGVPRIVFPSSKMVYGPVQAKHTHPRYEPVLEDHPREPQKLYGKLKRAIEDVAEHYASLYGLDIRALRFGSAYAPGKFGRHDKVSPVMGIIEAAIAKRPMVLERGGEQRDDLCYSGESANGAIAALTAPLMPGRFAVYNIASGEMISMSEMIAVLRQLFPAWEGSVGAGLDYRNIGSGYYFLMSTEKARKEIGFEPKFDFKRAAEDYVETLKRIGA
jgi:UDP-glucose 4-epimerase